MKPFRYYSIYKPYGMLCQFTSEQEGDVTLDDLEFSFPPDVYPVGRLDKDSEGLLLLTNDNQLKTAYLTPTSRIPKTYLVQVEGQISTAAIKRLEGGVSIKISGKVHTTFPAKAKIIREPGWLPERNPPVRFRKNIPTSWLELTIVEGKNRQVRKMTAKAGFPTLRLIRSRIGSIAIGEFTGKVVEIERPKIF